MTAAPAAYSRAILWAAHPEVLRQRAGGMSVLERQLFTIARAGLKTVFVSQPPPSAAGLAALRVPSGLDVRWLTAGGGAAECEAPYLGISSDYFLRVETLAAIARRPTSESIGYEDGRGGAVAQAVPTREDALSRRPENLPAGSYLRLEAPLSRGGVVDWLMAVCVKPQDGFMARHFDRHLSLAASRLLLDTPITPNQMTVFSTILGLVGATFFLGDDRAYYVAGALLVWLHSVLDGCDGELARVRFQESAFGSDLDFWGDNLVHLALFTCLGLGFRMSGHHHTLALAAIADVGVLASAWTAWGHRRAARAARGPEALVVDEVGGDGFESKLSRLENALAQRDFIYLLVVLAFLDMVYEFLWAAAIGGCLYFAIMLYLRRINNEQARQPHPAR